MTTPATRIAVTPGEPAGIGPDLCLLQAQQPQDAELVTICDPQLLEERAERMGLPFSYRRFDPDSAPRGTRAGELCILPVALRAPVECGRLDSANASYVLETLDRAIDGCLQGTFAALCP
jgi:4-hydroxythreonine-4-phosphate dehydrogenase